jgi:hypothetical protein
MSFDDFVDTQNINLRNVTDNVTYTQATQISADFEANLTRRQLTNNQFENLWDLLHGTYEAEVMLTQSEVSDLILLMTQTNNQPPTKTWRIIMVSDDNQSIIIEGIAQLGKLKFIDSGEGSMIYALRLDFASVGVVTL